MFREKTCLKKWIELSTAEQTYEGLRDLIVKEQVIEVCPRDLSIYLPERTPRDLNEMARIGEKFLEARGRQLYQGGRPDNRVKEDYTSDKKPTELFKGTLTCLHCKKTGHLAKDCKRPSVGSRTEFKCYSCGKPGHISSNCHKKKLSAAGAATEEHQDFVGTTSPTEELQGIMGLCGVGSIIATENKSQQFDTTLECIRDDHLLLANGKSLSLVMNASQRKLVMTK